MTEPSTESKLRTVFCTTLGVESSIFDEELMVGDIPQWDSLGHVNLLMAVEQAYGISFDAVDAIEVESLGDLIDLIERYCND